MSKNNKFSEKMSKLITDLADTLKGRDLREFKPIYLINETTVAKKHEDEFDAANEFRWGRFLLGQGINVPEMFELLGPEQLIPEVDQEIARQVESRKLWFLLMERIKGKDFFDMSGEDRTEALRQFRVQLERILERGILPRDCGYGRNYLFNREQQKLYFLDFAYWREAEDKSELTEYRKLVGNPSRLWDEFNYGLNYL